jgi:hypothetical protein
MSTVSAILYVYGNAPAFAVWHRVVRRYDGVAGADVADLKELFKLAIDYENIFFNGLCSSEYEAYLLLHE